MPSVRPRRLPQLSFVLLLALPIAAQRDDAGERSREIEGVRAAAQRFAAAVGVEGKILGAVLFVQRGDDVLLHEALGFRDVAGERAMQRDTLFRMASNTKAVTAAAVLALVDDGVVGLDDPIATWLPTFAAGDAGKITVRQLLSHTSGLRIAPLFLQPLMSASAQHPDAPRLVLEAARFGEVGPQVEPGTSYSYSNAGYNTLAALVEVASGQGFAEFCQQRFYAPLAMSDSCHHETVADNERMATVVGWREDGAWQVKWRPGDAPTVPFVRGSGGMISTAADYARFARMMLGRGALEDVRVLSGTAVGEMRRCQTSHIDKANYGLGWVVEAGGVFSHGGSDGTWLWCDPARDLVGMVLTQTQGREVMARAREFRAEVTAACAMR